MQSFWNKIKLNTTDIKKILCIVVGACALYYFSVILIVSAKWIENTGLSTYQTRSLYLVVFIMVSGTMIWFVDYILSINVKKDVNIEYNIPSVYVDIFVERYNSIRRNLMVFIGLWLGINSKIIDFKDVSLPFIERGHLSVFLTFLIIWETYHFYIGVIAIRAKHSQHKEVGKRLHPVVIWFEERLIIYLAGVVMLGQALMSFDLPIKP